MGYGVRSLYWKVTRVDTIANLKLQRGIFMKNVGRDMVLVLCTPSDDGLYLYLNLKKISSTV